MSGILYITSTPIGNLEDITLRALRILKEVDLIVSEAPRETLKLLTHYGIRKPLLDYSEHQWYHRRTPHKAKRIEQIMERLQGGEKVALVSKAGTPLISDPGYELINAVLAKDIKVVPIPGVTAVTTALSVSGLPLDRFIFEGFLPLKKSKRARRLQEAAEQSATVVFYESPYRIIRTLREMREHFGNRRVTIARELTKFYEEVIRGSLDEVITQLTNRPIKGEFTIIIEGTPPSSVPLKRDSGVAKDSRPHHLPLTGSRRDNIMRF